MTNRDAMTVLWEEVEGIPSDCFDEGTERFKEAVELAIKALKAQDKKDRYFEELDNRIGGGAK